MTTITAIDLDYRVSGIPLVADIGLTAGPGELVAIVGPNGAGKSTLLDLLAGERAATTGRVVLDGLEVAHLHPSELARIRALLRSGAGDVPFTVRHVVALGRHPHLHDPENDSARDEKAIEIAMRLVQIEHLGERIFSSLSGGEQMRVSIARILAQDAPILFLDEPTGPLDVAHRERVLRLLRSEADAGRSVITVLHDLNTAAAHATRVVLMSEGTIVADGAPTEVLRADLLTSVYRHRMHVVPHPVADGPLVVADPGERDT